MSNKIEIAKLIKSELNATFPDVKFNVRVNPFYPLDCICISWERGPMMKDVDYAISKNRSEYPEGLVRVLPFTQTNERLEVNHIFLRRNNPTIL